MLKVINDVEYNIAPGSNLSYSNLSESNLRGSDLSESNLSESNLSWSNLRGSNLRGSNLRGSNLMGAIGNMLEIKSLQLETWPITYTADRLQIGCQNHSIEEWRGFDDETIETMAEGAIEFWHKWKDIILKIIELSPATPTGHEGKDCE